MIKEFISTNVVHTFCSEFEIQWYYRVLIFVVVAFLHHSFIQSALAMSSVIT